MNVSDAVRFFLLEERSVRTIAARIRVEKERSKEDSCAAEETCLDADNIIALRQSILCGLSERTCQTLGLRP